MEISLVSTGFSGAAEVIVLFCPGSHIADCLYFTSDNLNIGWAHVTKKITWKFVAARTKLHLHVPRTIDA